jgi:hypothetical protein
MYEESEKANEKRLCEFFESTFNDGSGLNKHLKKFKAMEFANSISKYYSISTKLAIPKILAALRLMSTTVYGMEKFEALLDQESLVSHRYLFFK